MSILINKRVIGIFGLAKNTGKTTTLNALIKSTLTPFALTSIGVDGEAIDQVTALPKPKIIVPKNTIVATARECLSELTDYIVLDETTLRTSLGNIVIIKTQKTAKILLAGPTTNTDLTTLIKRLKTYVDTIYIDGAFNRLTFTSINAIDHIIMATGATLNSDMDKVIDITKHHTSIFQLPKTKRQFNAISPVLIFTEKTIISLNKKQINTITKTIKNNHVKAIFIKGAITEKLIDQWINHAIKNITLIVEDPTKLLINKAYYTYLQNLNITIEVLKKIQLDYITINPTSPKITFDADLFKEKLASSVDIPVINVLKGDDDFGAKLKSRKNKTMS